MTTLRTAAQQALEALERAALQPVGKSTHDAIAALRAALEQQEPEQTHYGKAIPSTKNEMREWNEKTWNECQAKTWSGT